MASVRNGCLWWLQVYEPRPEVLADAHKTGHALMIAAAAQRAKRASQRRAPVRSGFGMQISYAFCGSG